MDWWRGECGAIPPFRKKRERMGHPHCGSELMGGAPAAVIAQLAETVTAVDLESYWYPRSDNPDLGHPKLVAELTFLKPRRSGKTVLLFFGGEG